MRIRRMPDIKEGGVNVTPLIDVVMCLIIFFMLVARIGVNTADESIDVPASVLGLSIRDMGNTLTLNVTNGPKSVAGAEAVITVVGPNGQMIPLSLTQQLGGRAVHPLRDVLQRLREGDPSRGLPPNPEFKVIIRGDKSLTYNFLAPVLVECNLARVKTIDFDTRIRHTF